MAATVVFEGLLLLCIVIFVGGIELGYRVGYKCGKVDKKLEEVEGNWNR